MAKIAGITIKLDADASGIEKALRDIDSKLNKTQSNLKNINKALKFDPKSTDLLTQKQKALEDAIKLTKDRVEQLKQAQSQVAKGSAEWNALQQEIVMTESSLKQLEQEYRNFGSVAKQQVIAAGNSMKEVGDKISGVGRKLQPVSAAAAGVVAGLTGMAYKAVTSADDLNTLAKQTGFTTAELQKMQYASDLIDVEMETITGAAARMTKQLGSSEDKFTNLGVATRDVDGNFRSTSEIFYDTIYALSQIENETERDTVAMDIFGKSANELAGIVDDGGAALKEFGDQAENAGLILDQETLDTLNKTNDTIDTMKAKLGGELLKVGAKLAEALVPVIDKISAGFEKLVAWLDQLTPEQLEMVTTIALIIAVAAPLLTIIGGIISGIGSIVSAVGMLFSPVGGVIALIALVIAAGVALYKNWDNIKAWAIELWNSVVNTWNSIRDGVVNAVTAIRDGAVNAWNTMVQNVTTAVETLKTSVANAWDGLKARIASVVANVKSQVQSMIDKFNSAKTAVQNAINRLKAILNTTLSFPHIKVPHFNINGGEVPWGIGGKGYPPSISIDWYKRAYDNPIMFTQPTVLATAAGMKGFGDGSGAEIVMSLEKLQQLVGSQGDRPVVVQVSLEGDARGLFKAVQRTNSVRTKATNYNALAVGG